jgi:DNA-binding response OmpR family regulator
MGNAKFQMALLPLQLRHKKTLKILLIDGERDQHAVLKLVLSCTGTGSLLSCTTGIEGIATANHMQPDVILLESRLPDLNGELVLRILTSHPSTCSIPVILFTECASDLDFFEGLPYAEAVLKPFSVQHLCAVIRRVNTSRAEVAQPDRLVPGNRYLETFVQAG